MSPITTRRFMRKSRKLRTNEVPSAKPPEAAAGVGMKAILLSADADMSSLSSGENTRLVTGKSCSFFLFSTCLRLRVSNKYTLQVFVTVANNDAAQQQREAA